MSSGPVARPPLDLIMPAGMRLRKALVTTYDPPGADVLLDEYLPRWLGMSRRPTQEGVDEAYLAERYSLLREARGAIAVFHSHSNLESHPWIWSFVDAFSLAPKYRQHAKVWLFHWVPRERRKDKQLLQVVVSSMNLTDAAMRSQLQAAWSTTVGIDDPERFSLSRQAKWGGLRSFIEVLPSHTSKLFKNAPGKVCGHFLGLLGRATPPAGAAFIASIPQPKATMPHDALASALKGTAVERIDALVPFVGPWKPAGLQEWLAQISNAKKSDKKIHVLWQGHPSSRWYLRQEDPGNVQVMKFDSGVFRGHEAQDDPRWSHAKVYQFSGRADRGSRPHVLITSANFTEAAWGNPATGARPKNFEVGVLFPGRGFAFARGQLQRTDFPEPDEVTERTPGVVAVWDGNKIAIETGRFLRGLDVLTERNKHRATSWGSVKKPSGGGVIPWASDAAKGRPVSLRWHDAEDAGCCAIQWVGRALAEGDDLPSEPGIPAERREELEAAIISERYGGAWVETNEPDDDEAAGSKQGKKSRGTGKAASYSLAVIQDARRLGAVIDGWNEALGKAKWSETLGEDGEHARLLKDGERLSVLWQKLGDRSDGSSRIAYSVAADELAGRIDSAARGEQ